VPGYTVAKHHGLATAVSHGGSANQGVAGKSSGALDGALSELQITASGLGANAVIGLQMVTVSRSIGGIMGDQVSVTLIGSAVTLAPIETAPSSQPDPSAG